MGISTISSYRGSQLFECVGLNQEVVDLCFCDTTNRLSGTTFSDLQSDQIKLAKNTWSERKNIKLIRKSLVAKKEIKKGDLLNKKKNFINL